jgi:hypothetical protein
MTASETKEYMLDVLRHRRMTLAEIKQTFGLRKSQALNYLTSLRTFNLVLHDKASRTYTAVPNAGSYAKAYRKAKQEGVERAIAGQKPPEEKHPLATTVVSANDYHTTRSMGRRRSAWVGSTLSTADF